MCFINGVLDSSSKTGLFRVRISAFGSNKDNRLYEQAEFPIYLNSSAELPIQVSVTLPCELGSQLHAITLTWATEVDRSELKSCLMLLSDHMGGFHPGGSESTSWTVLASYLIDSFLSAQRLLRDYSRRNPDVPESHTFHRDEIEPIRQGLVWVSRTQPKRVDRKDFVERFPNEVDRARSFVQAELPTWFLALKGKSTSYFLDGMFRAPMDFCLRDRNLALQRVG